jgi:uncharacterized membrane protein
MAKAKDFFTAAQQEALLNAIREAENLTSGEIRLHIENSFKGDVLDRSAYIFQKLKMHETRLRNGILFYLALENRSFAIIGDKGIHEKVQDVYWEDLKTKVLEYFKRNEFTEGLSFGILETGQQLKKFFPFQKDDVNELPDEISFGK